MKKQILALFMAAVMAGSLTACGSSGADATTAAATEAATTGGDAAEAATTAADADLILG